MNWQNYKGETLRQPIMEAVEAAILHENEIGNRLKVFIGTDSQIKRGVIEFATVIVFLREHKGGFMFIHKERKSQPMRIKERMLLEVQKSIEIAYQLCPILDKHQVALEVHADINSDPNFQSNVAFKDAMGYIMGMGFAFRAKPESFASTSCANRIVQ